MTVNCNLPGPTLESGDHKESEHSVHDVVIMKLAPLPDPLLDQGLVDVPVLVGDELALASLIVVHAQVGADEELPLEQLDTNDPEHEDEEHGDRHDVADGLDRHDHALHDLLEAGRSVDGAERTEHPEHTENLQETDPGASEDGDQRHGDDHDIKDIEGNATESAFVEEKPIRDEFESALKREHGGEEVVKLAEDDVDVRLGSERILASQEGGGHKDTDQDDVRDNWMGLDLPAEHSEGIGLTEDEE